MIDALFYVMGSERNSCVRTVLLVLLFLTLAVTICRETFDFLGRMWLLILSNFLHILFIIFAIFGTFQLRPNFLVIFMCWNPVWIAWNLFLGCLWLNIGGLNNKADVLSFNTGSVSWWREHTGCRIQINSTTGQRIIDLCKVDYFLIEAVQAFLQVALSFCCFILSIVLFLMFLRKLGDRNGTISRRNQPRITMELATDQNTTVIGHPEGPYRTDGNGNVFVQSGYNSDTTGYLNASFESGSPHPAQNAEGYYVNNYTNHSRFIPSTSLQNNDLVKQHGNNHRSSKTSSSQRKHREKACHRDNTEYPPENRHSNPVYIENRQMYQVSRRRSPNDDKRRDKRRRRSYDEGVLANRRSRDDRHVESVGVINVETDGAVTADVNGRYAKSQRRHNSVPNQKRKHRKDRDQRSSAQSPSALSGRSSAMTVESRVTHNNDSSPTASQSTPETIPSNQKLASLQQNFGSRQQIVSGVQVLPIQKPKNFKHVPTPGIAKFQHNLAQRGPSSSLESQDSFSSVEQQPVPSVIQSSNYSHNSGAQYYEVPRSEVTRNRRERQRSVTPDSELSANPIDALVTFDPSSNTLIRYHEHSNIHDNPPPPPPHSADLEQSNADESIEWPEPPSFLPTANLINDSVVPSNTSALNNLNRSPRSSQSGSVRQNAKHVVHPTVPAYPPSRRVMPPPTTSEPAPPYRHSAAQSIYSNDTAITGNSQSTYNASMPYSSADRVSYDSGVGGALVAPRQPPSIPKYPPRSTFKTPIEPDYVNRLGLDSVRMSQPTSYQTSLYSQNKATPVPLHQKLAQHFQQQQQPSSNTSQPQHQNQASSAAAYANYLNKNAPYFGPSDNNGGFIVPSVNEKTKLYKKASLTREDSLPDFSDNFPRPKINLDDDDDFGSNEDDTRELGLQQSLLV